MKNKTIANLKKLLDCKSLGELAPLLGVSLTSLSRAANNKEGKQFKHICEVLEMILKDLPKDKLSICRDNLKFMYS